MHVIDNQATCVTKAVKRNELKMDANRGGPESVDGKDSRFEARDKWFSTYI